MRAHAGYLRGVAPTLAPRVAETLPAAPLADSDDDIRPLHGARFDPAIVEQARALGGGARRIYDFVAPHVDHALS